MIGFLLFNGDIEAEICTDCAVSANGKSHMIDGNQNVEIYPYSMLSNAKHSLSCLIGSYPPPNLGSCMPGIMDATCQTLRFLLRQG